jgi:hypothetical protein
MDILKKVLYIALLVAEFLFGSYILFVTSVLVSWWLLVSVLPVWVALMVWQFIRLKKETDAKKKGKIKFLIALINLLPTIAALITIFIIGSMLGL